MQSYAKRILCLHDLSSVGRCSLSVISPVLTALSLECACLPTALLSTHTGGFGDVAALAAGDFVRRALMHFKREQIRFHAVYSGYLGTPSAADAVELAFLQYDDALKVVDPVCADGGRVYSSISGELLKAIKRIAAMADIITPNITEAKILLARQYELSQMSEREAVELCAALRERYSPRGVVTSVLIDGELFNAIYDDGVTLYPYKGCENSYPGTGDLFAAVLTAAVLRGEPFVDAARRATDIASAAVELTAATHREARYGLALERLIPALVSLSEHFDEQNQQ